MRDSGEMEKERGEGGGTVVERRRHARYRSRAVEDPRWVADAAGEYEPSGLALGGRGQRWRRWSRPPEPSGRSAAAGELRGSARGRHGEEDVREK